MMNQVITAARNKPPAEGEKRKFIRRCQKISVILRKNLGTIKGEIETGANQ